jgi:hypothetical protein
MFGGLMKKYLLLLLVIMINNNIFCQETAQNQKPEKKFTIQTSPALFLFDLAYVVDYSDYYSVDGKRRKDLPGWKEIGFIMDLEGQYKINDSMNVSLTVSFFRREYFREIDGFQMNIKPMFIYRPYKTGLSGFYIGLYPGIGWDKFEYYDYDRDLDTLEYLKYNLIEIDIGLNTGYKWVFKNGFTLQLGAGIGKTFILPKKPIWRINPDLSFIETILLGPLNSDGRFSFKYFDVHIIDLKLGYSF